MPRIRPARLDEYGRCCVIGGAPAMAALDEATTTDPDYADARKFYKVVVWDASA